MRLTRSIPITVAIPVAVSFVAVLAACSGSGVSGSMPQSSAGAAGAASAAPSLVAAASAAPSATAVASPSARPAPIGAAVIGGVSSPVELAFVGDSVWVTEHMENKVARFSLDGTKRAVVDVSSAVATDTGPASIVQLGGKLFVTNQNAFGLTRIDPTAGRVEAFTKERTHAPCANATVAAGSIWFLACDEGAVVRMGPDLKTLASIPLGTTDSLDGLLAAGGRVWGTAGGRLFAIDPATGTLATYDVAGVPKAVGDGSLWLVDGGGKHVLRVDPTTGRSTATIDLPASADDLAFGGGSAWVVSAFPIQDRSTVYRIDAASNAVVGSEAVIGQPPGNPAFRGGTLWLPEFDAGQVVTVPAF